MSAPTEQLLRVQNFMLSTDGYGTGEGQSIERPFGHADPAVLASWAGATASWPNRTDPGAGWVCSRSSGGSRRRIVQVIVTGSPSGVPAKTIAPPSRRSTEMSASNGSHQSASRSGVVMASHTSWTS